MGNTRFVLASSIYIFDYNSDGLLLGEMPLRHPEIRAGVKRGESA